MGFQSCRVGKKGSNQIIHILSVLMSYKIDDMTNTVYIYRLFLNTT